MRTVKSATPDVLKRLEENLAFKEVKRMADGFCSKWYLVGGRAYRTLAEELHSEKCSASDCDWDFICFDTSLQDIQYDGWKKTRGPGSVNSIDSDEYSFRPIKYGKLTKGVRSLSVEERKRSSRFEGGKYGQKVDFIAIEDIISENGTLQDYFNAVPLDIQAIALDFKARLFIGDMGISSVCRKTIRLKERTALKSVDPDTYIESKRVSLLPMRFTINESVRHRCYCFPDDIKALFTHGCKCGGI